MSAPRVPTGVFLILLASYAYFWHSRDWNAATRLMLTYSLVDRGQVRINGLEDHTRDRARIGDDYFTDKQPGYSLLGVPSYAIGRLLLGLPPHPLNRTGPTLPYWPGDYLVTLATSGVMSAGCGALLAAMASGLGCGPKRSALVGLSYGLSTPAYVYATLSYGHQATAFLQLAAFAAIGGAQRHWRWSILAGFCASFASVVEIQSGPVSAILGVYVLGLVLSRKARPRTLIGFTAGAIGPVAILLAYNFTAFGSPFDMGYFHEDLDQFKKVHAPDNPLGLRRLDFKRIPDLLWSEHRGLLIYAPILALAPLGWMVLAFQRRWAILLISTLSCASILAVNLSYPEWTGGWSTGPRFLVPAIPFAMLSVAALLSLDRRWIVVIAVCLALLGGLEMLMFQAVGGRIPHTGGPETERPFRQVVWPIVRGDPLPWWKQERGERFERTLGDSIFATWTGGLPPSWRWAQFVPFVTVQVVSIGALMAIAGRREPNST